MFQPTPDLSVCICTHNPRRQYLARVLEALRGQTLGRDAWELIIIDNQSREPVAAWADLSGLPGARIVTEETLGLTNARLRAIREARGAVLVLVDDDNVLQPDYLEHARRIMTEKPFLGVIGGRCRGDFEIPPPRWAWHYFPYLAVTDHGDHPLYTFHRNVYQSWYPCGAGMVIRREFAEAYAAQVEHDAERRMLDRRGASLASAGDIDMVLTVMDLGSGIGFFPELVLKHIIPRERLELGYLRRMVFHSNYSYHQLMFSRQASFRPRRWPLAYVTGVILCCLQGYCHPYSLILACSAAHGRYAALREFLSAGGQTRVAPQAPPPSMEKEAEPAVQESSHSA